MTELTKQLLTKLDRTSVLVANLVENLREVPANLKTIQATLDSHTSVLDLLAKQTKDWNAEMAVMRNRMDRYEVALKTVGERLNLDLEALLH